MDCLLFNISAKWSNTTTLSQTFISASTGREESELTSISLLTRSVELKFVLPRPLLLSPALFRSSDLLYTAQPASTSARSDTDVVSPSRNSRLPASALNSLAQSVLLLIPEEPTLAKSN